MRIHQEGMLFIAGAFALAILAHLINTSFGILVTILACLVLYFFRDPERVLPDCNAATVISPADGVVIDVLPDTIKDNGEMQEMMRISIFLSPFDVHVNRIPYAGKIIQKIYKKGTFAHAGSERALAQNESLTLKIEGEQTIFVRQVAGMLARRIVCYSETGDVVRLGERYGIIKFGSRVDLYLPKTANIAVKKGQTMICGETILARLD